MNVFMNECFFMNVRTTFLLKKMHDFDVFDECVTNQPTDQPMDAAYYRDAMTHLKTLAF